MDEPLGELLPPKMSKVEIAYDAHLALQKAAGEIVEFWFEKITLKLGPDCRYSPDFMVMRTDRVLELHETKPIGGAGIRAKGGPRFGNDSIVKLRACAGSFPFPCFIVTPEDKGMTRWVKKRVVYEQERKTVPAAEIHVSPETIEIRGLVPMTGRMTVMRRKVIG